MFDTDGGSIQLILYPDEQDFGSTACICSLWIDENQRGRGIAKRLLDTAERIATELGHKDIVLNYKSKDTSSKIFDWYRRCGYEVEYAQLKKLLEKNENRK